MKGRVLEAHLNTERGVASRGSDNATAAPGGTGPRPPGTTTRTRGARCDRSGARRSASL